MYFLALVLPQHLDAQILRLKLWMQERYGCRVALKSPAHLTIEPPFWAAAGNEAPLKQDLETFCLSTQAFRLQTTGFSAFPPRTLFIALQENPELATLKRKADDFFRHRPYRMKIGNRPFHPHVTIATRDLQKKDFAEAWEHFRQHDFREAFDATGLSLLKHNGRMWEVVFTASFGPARPADADGLP